MGYLTFSEYVDRVGEEETRRLTSETRGGPVDSAKVDDAIQDASDEIDGYLAKRYTTPLTTVPNIVKGWCEILAREALHQTRAPDQVKEEAARVRRQLSEASRGIMVLAGVGGAVEPSPGSGDSASSEDGRVPVFNECSMAGFGTFSRYPIANWKR